MKSSSHNKTIVILMGFSAICFLAAVAVPTKAVAGAIGAWYSILPPLIAVSLAFLTHRVIPSIGIAILAGGLLVSVPDSPTYISSWTEGIGKAFGYVFASATDSTNLQILVFVVLIMSMISLMITSGGLQALVSHLLKFAKTRRSTKMVTFLSGLLIFFDDYSNSMIIGSAMRKATDKQKVSREKLAFIVDATSAPVAGLAVISTWIGYEVGLFGDVSKSLGLGTEGYAMFFDAIGFRFYCWMMLAFVFLNIYFGKDFGPMARAESRAIDEGKLKADDAISITSQGFSKAETHQKARASIFSAILPLGVLITFLISGFWVDGGGPEKFGLAGLFSFAAWRETISGADNSILILAYGGGAGLLVATLCAKLIAQLKLRDIRACIWGGFKAGFIPIVILIFAWSLKGACDALHTGNFLAATLGDSMPPLVFPALLFIVAGVTSFGTGTSWGTMAILIPTAIPVAFQLDGGSYGLITMMSLGAVLDGSIFGDHCSPISDTTILSSIATDCDHMAHVETQIPYALTVGTVAVVLGYLPAAMGMNPLFGVLGGALIFGFLFFGFTQKSKRLTLGSQPS